MVLRKKVKGRIMGGRSGYIGTIDQCSGCTVRGNFYDCLRTPCSKRDDWIVTYLLSKIQAFESREFPCRKVEIVVVDEYVEWPDNVPKPIIKKKE